MRSESERRHGADGGGQKQGGQLAVWEGSGRGRVEGPAAPGADDASEQEGQGEESVNQ